MAWRYCLARGVGWNWVVLVELRVKVGLMASRLARVSAQGTTFLSCPAETGGCAGRTAILKTCHGKHWRAGSHGYTGEDWTNPSRHQAGRDPSHAAASKICCGRLMGHGCQTLLCSGQCMAARLCARAADAVHGCSRQASHLDSRSLRGPPCGSTGTACRLDCKRMRLWLCIAPAEAARQQSKSLSRMAPTAAICRAEDESDLMLLKIRSRP